MLPALIGTKVQNARYIPTVGPLGVQWKLSNPDEVQLVLPPVDHAMKEQLGDSFRLVVRDYFEDERALAVRFRYVFDVTVRGATGRPDGLLDLRYRAELESCGDEPE
jgi:hypothetical protein